MKFIVAIAALVLALCAMEAMIMLYGLGVQSLLDGVNIRVWPTTILGIGASAVMYTSLKIVERITAALGAK